MRKDVFYSLMAMTVVPVAANATDMGANPTPGWIIPDVVSFDNNVADQDGLPEDGIIKWYQGDVTLSISKPLVAGKYTFRAHALTSAVGFYVQIPAAGVDQLQPIGNEPVNGDFTQYVQENGRDIEVNFELAEDQANGIQIKLVPVTEFEKADNKFFFISDRLDKEGVQAGLSFDIENFEQPLEDINDAINLFVNNSTKYESEAAKLALSAAKELIQRLTANPENMTYDEFVGNELNKEPITDSKLYKEVVGLFNKATRIEAEYQANRLQKQLDDAKAAVLKIDEDGVEGPDYTEEDKAYTILADLAAPIEAKIAAYKAKATEETPYAMNDDNKESADAPAEFDEEFDVDPTYSPLKEIWEDVTSLTGAKLQEKADGKGYQVDKTGDPGAAGDLYEALVVSYENNDAAAEELADMMAEIKEANPQAPDYNTAVQKFITYYRNILEATEKEITGKGLNEDEQTPIADMDATFVKDMKAQMKVADDNVRKVENEKVTYGPYIQDFADMYDNFQKALAALNGNVEIKPLTPEAEARLEAGETEGFGDNYDDMTQKYNDLMEGAVANIPLPALQNAEESKDNKLKDKTGVIPEEGATTYPSVDPDIDEDAAAIDANFVADLNAYIDGLNELDKAYTTFEAAEEAIQNFLIDENGEEKYPNTREYNSRNFFKEAFTNSYYEEVVDEETNEVTGWQSVELVNAPGEAGENQEQDENYYTHMQFLKKVSDQLEDMWGSFDNQDKYTKHEFFTLADYAAAEGKFMTTLDKFEKQLTTEQANHYYPRIANDLFHFSTLDRLLNFYEDAVNRLEAKAKSSTIWDADPALYLIEDGYVPQLKEGDKFNYDHPEADGKYNSYKKILLGLKAAVKGYEEQMTALLDQTDPENYNNSTTSNHSQKRWALQALFLEPDGLFAEDGKGIEELKGYLKYIDEFVADGGIIDQQQAKYAENLPADNYEKFADQLAGKTEDLNDLANGMLYDLQQRLKADKEGGFTFGDTENLKGYAADTNEDGDADYKVGYDQDGKDGVTLNPDELINYSMITPVQSFKSPIYGQEITEENEENAILLSKVATDRLKDLFSAFERKLKEASDIYKKNYIDANPAGSAAQEAEYTAVADAVTLTSGKTYYTSATGEGEFVAEGTEISNGENFFEQTKEAQEAQPAWTKADYEKAVAELGQAVTIVNEVNDKLEGELETPMIGFVKAIKDLQKIREENLDKAIAVDEETGEQTGSQMSTATYKELAIASWTNGQKGLKKVEMKDCENLLEQFRPLIAQLGNGGPADEEAYEEAKAKLNPNDKAIYEELEDLYERALALRQATDNAYLQGNPMEQWNSTNKAEFEQLEKDIKAWVNKCGKEEKSILDNNLALFNLMTHSNIDDNDDDPYYDWFNLIEEDVAAGAVDYPSDIKPKEDAEKAAYDALIKNFVKNGVKFKVADLLNTTGIEAIEANDAEAKSADDLLEPIVENEDGSITKLNTYYNMLAAPGDEIPAQENWEAEVEAARRLVDAEASVAEEEGGMIYELVKAFVKDVNEMMVARTLKKNEAQMLQRFENIVDYVLNIDERAQANKDQHNAMMDGYEDAEGNEVMGYNDLLNGPIAEAETAIEGMDEGSTARAMAQELQNLINEKMKAFKGTVDKEYQDGIASDQEQLVPSRNVKTDEDAALATLTAEVLANVAKITGADGENGVIAEANLADYADFQKDYNTANKEYAALVKKLDQFKNLDGDVPAEVKDDASNVAKSANKFLFGSEAIDNPEDATETALDKLDKFYAEGTANLNKMVDGKVQPWSQEYQEGITTIKETLEALIGNADAVINSVLEAWAGNDFSNKVFESAFADFQKYSIYWEDYKAWQKQDAAAKKIEDVDARKAAQALADAAKVAFVEEDVIEDNLIYDALYDASTEQDEAIKTVKDSKRKIGDTGIETYTANLNINEFYDTMNELADFDEDLEDAKDIEADADVDDYVTHAAGHLANDETTLEKWGFTAEDEIEGLKGAKFTLQALIDRFNEATKVKDEDGEYTEEYKDFTVDNWEETILEMQKLVGKKQWNEETEQAEWDEFGECAFVHQLDENMEQGKQLDEQGTNDLIAALDVLKTNCQEALDYMKDYEVAPTFLKDILEISNDVQKAYENARDENNYKSAHDLAKTVEMYQISLGNVLNNPAKEDFSEEIGTMDAEIGKLPGFIKTVFDAEKARLKDNINELRAELKKYTEAGNEDTDGALNAQIEALWDAVNAAECTAVYEDYTYTDDKGDKQTVKDGQFVGWDRGETEEVPNLLLNLQEQIKDLYKTLRDLNESSIDVAQLKADLSARLQEVEDAPVSDYAAGAPTVEKIQNVLDFLVADAKARIAAADAAGDIDFLREVLTDYVMNAEAFVAQRDAEAAKIDAAKDAADAEVEAFSEIVENSKAKVNAWVEGLAGNADSAPYYQKAETLLDEILQLTEDYFNAYPLVNDGEGGYKFDESKIQPEFITKNADLVKALFAAEDAAARFDLTPRLQSATQRLNNLSTKFENNEFTDDVWDAAINLIDKISGAIEDQMKELAVNPRNKYNKILEAIEKYELNEDEVLELVSGINFDLDALDELLDINIVGDADGDGKVTLRDARIIANYAMGLEGYELPVQGSDDFITLDVNGDGNINMADASAAVSLYFYGNIYGMTFEELAELEDKPLARAEGNDKVTVETMKISEGLTRLAINLDNAQQFTGFQMDLQLPEGMKLVVASLAERAGKQFLMTNEMDGVLRIGAMSVKNETFSGNNGAVLYLDFEVAEGTDNFARFDNVLFVNKQNQAVQFNLGGITPTGIQSANAETALGQKFYDLSGRMKNSMKKGVNIIRDAAGKAKKVLVK